MEQTEPVWTHKGWMLFCPIKLAEPFSGAPHITARWWWLEYLLDFTEGFQGAVIMLISLVNPQWEPHFFFVVTGEL